MHKKIFILLLILIAVSVGANFALAATLDVSKQLTTLKGVGLPEGSPLDLTVKIIKILLSTLALIFIVLVLYGGVKWMTSGGAAESIEKAKEIIKAAVIGMIVVFLAYAITAFVFNVIMKM